MLKRPRGRELRQRVRTRKTHHLPTGAVFSSADHQGEAEGHTPARQCVFESPGHLLGTIMRKEEWRPPSLPPCLRASLTTSVPHAVQQDCNTDNKHCADSTPAHMRQCIAAYGCVHTFSRACTRERRADKNTETDTFGFPPLSVLHTSIHDLTIRVWVSLLLTLFLTLVSLDDNEERKQHEDKTMHTEGNHPMRTAGLPRAVALCVHHTCVRESARAGGGGQGENGRANV